MVSVFPILFLASFAHLILRVCTGIILLYLGVQHLGSDRETLIKTTSQHYKTTGTLGVWLLGITELILGGLLFVGAWTQVAALVTAFLCIKMLIVRKHLKHPSIPQPMFYILLLGVTLSLVITGAGAFGIDLPI